MRPHHANPDSDDRLATVLGTVRADLLRALRHPTTLGALSVRLHLSLSTVSYHGQRLEEAHLIERERHGHQELVLTPSGRDLLRMFQTR